MSAARRAADFQAAGPGAVEDFQAVGFDLEKGLVTRPVPGRQPAGRQHQPIGGAGFDFFNQRMASAQHIGGKCALNASAQRYIQNLAAGPVFGRIRTHVCQSGS